MSTCGAFGRTGRHGPSHGVRPSLLAFALVIGSCANVPPLVLALSAASVPEGVQSPLRLSTRSCTPAFDLDRGELASESDARVRLEPGGRELPAMRTAVEEFATVVPADLPPGSYQLALALGDGRLAPYSGRLDVARAAPVIERVSSTRSAVGVGEGAVPLAVTLFNPSQCAVDGLVVEPVFRRGSMDYSGAFSHPISRVRLGPGARVRAQFAVDVGAAATAGPVTLDARATGGVASGGPGCSGSVAIAAASETGQWVLVLSSQQVLDVVALDPRPGSPRPGEEFRLEVSLLNSSAVDLTVRTLTMLSAPEGIALARATTLNQPTLPAGMTRGYVLALRTDVAAMPGAVFTVAVEATATDAAGQVYTTRPGVPATTVTLRAR